MFPITYRPNLARNRNPEKKIKKIFKLCLLKSNKQYLYLYIYVW